MQALAAMCSHVPNKGNKWSDTMAFNGYYIVQIEIRNRKNRKEDPQAPGFMGRKAPSALRAVGSTSRRPPKATGSPKTAEYSIDYATSQLPASDSWLYIDPEYPKAHPA